MGRLWKTICIDIRRLRSPFPCRLRQKPKSATIRPVVILKESVSATHTVQPRPSTRHNHTMQSRPRQTWALMHVVTGLFKSICRELRFGSNSKNALYFQRCFIAFPYGCCKYRIFSGIIIRSDLFSGMSANVKLILIFNV